MAQRVARLHGGPHAGQLLVADHDEADSVIAVIYDDSAGERTFCADYWFETDQDLDAGLTEVGWEPVWLDS
jgi:hypothetical protein